jgi:uncharacterized membrane protein
MDIFALINYIGELVDLAGVLVIVSGMALATVIFVKQSFQTGFHGAYQPYRQRLGRVILLGLEILVAADIVRTVAIRPTIENMVVLFMIVVIRTFLSFALHLELEGHLPWQPAPKQNGNHSA